MTHLETWDKMFIWDSHSALCTKYWAAHAMHLALGPAIQHKLKLTPGTPSMRLV